MLYMLLFVMQILKSAELLGYFVKPDTWCKVLLENIKLSQSAGSIAILAAVIRGSNKEAINPFLRDIVNIITDPALCHVAEVCCKLSIFEVRILS